MATRHNFRILLMGVDVVMLDLVIKCASVFGHKRSKSNSQSPVEPLETLGVRSIAFRTVPGSLKWPGSNEVVLLGRRPLAFLDPVAL